MGVRPPSDDMDDEPDVIEFGIAALDARLEQLDVTFPTTAEELVAEYGDVRVPIDAAGTEITLAAALEKTAQQEFETERELLDEGGYERALIGEFVRESRELVTADGTVVETLLRAVPREDVRDDVIGTFAFYVDVSERKELEREKERLDEFTSIVSHDLRNPLNVAQGQTALARETGDLDHLDAVERAHERMQTLISDLLTLARSGQHLDEIAPVSVGSLAEDCWRNTETHGATLNVRTDRTVRADRTRLQQLIENLLRNAVDHGGDDVTVTVGELDDGFYVADDGPGVPEDRREDVFEAGYTTSDDGSGFGLSIVEQVAEAHGWTVTVTESDPGGARFEIRGTGTSE